MSRLFRPLVAALALLPLAGCDAVEMLDPSNGIGGSYDLVRIDGRGLPYELDAYSLNDGTRCEIEVVAGSIVVETDYDDRFELQLAYRESCRDRYGRTDVTYPVETERGDFYRRGDRFVFRPDNYEYFDDFDARVSGDDLVAAIGRFEFRFEEDRSVGW